MMVSAAIRMLFFKIKFHRTTSNVMLSRAKHLWLTHSWSKLARDPSLRSGSQTTKLTLCKSGQILFQGEQHEKRIELV